MNFSGNKMRLARLAHGYSLDQLGIKLEASRQYLNQLENERKSPTDEMILALASVLGVEVSFLDNEIISAVKPEQCHFRKQATTPVSIANQVMARGTLFEKLIAELDQLLELPNVNFPDIHIESDLDIEAAAEHCRSHWGLGDGPISNMIRVAENAGAFVSFFSGVSDRIDAFSIARHRPIIIRSESKKSACRLRFDIAHECGHLVIHQGIETGDKLREGQANRFASAFLLPRQQFAREFPKGKRLNWRGIYDLKLRWKVSAAAIIRRAYDLCLITADQYRIGSIYLRKTGQSKTEKYDEQINLENPEMLYNSFKTLINNDSNAVIDILLKTGMKKEILKTIINTDLLDKIIQFERNNVVNIFD